MKIIIASDIHGSAYWAERLIEAIDTERPDRVVLLGDLLYHGPRNDLPRDYAPKRVIPLLNDLAATGRLTAVRGNCEAEVDQMVLDVPCMADSSMLVDDHGRTLFFTHGHVFGAGLHLSLIHISSPYCRCGKEAPVRQGGSCSLGPRRVVQGLLGTPNGLAA